MPVVMSFADLDASGAAGLQADIQTVFAMGCHPMPVATSLSARTAFDDGGGEGSCSERSTAV